jgi:hypothetical protein
LGFYLLLSGDGEWPGRNHFLYNGSVENKDDNYGVSILTDTTTWRLLFLDCDIKAEDGVTAIE